MVKTGLFKAIDSLIPLDEHLASFQGNGYSLKDKNKVKLTKPSTRTEWKSVKRKSIFSLCYLFRNPFSSTTIRDKNLIRTLGDYSKPSHEGYRNTIELPVGNNVDPNQHLKDFHKLLDSLNLDGENKERTRLRLFQFSLRDQARNWLERLPAGSITTWEDLTTRFLAQFLPPGRTAKLRNDILMFQQHHGESLSEAWTQDLTLYDNESWNDPRNLAKPFKAIDLPQDVPSTSDRHLIELENQVQRFMEAHLSPTQPTQVNIITTSCETCSGPHDTQYCMENHEQAFVDYASSRTDEVGGKWYTFKPEKNDLCDTYNPSWKSHPNLRLSKFEADFKQQQSEITNKIDTVLEAITDRIAGTLPSDTVKNLKLSATPVLSAHSYPTKDPQCSTHIHSSINAITIHPKQLEESQVNEPDIRQEEKGNLGNINSNPYPQPDPLASIATEQVRKLNLMLESLGLVP
ncbi:MAK10-like protein [Tanacetum coccineum]